MPKSCSLRASMPMRTRCDHKAGGAGSGLSRQSSLPIPTAVVEPVLLAEIAAHAGEDVAFARRLFRDGDHGFDRARFGLDIGEAVQARGRDRAAHLVALEHRKPLAIEVAG